MSKSILPKEQNMFWFTPTPQKSIMKTQAHTCVGEHERKECAWANVIGLVGLPYPKRQVWHMFA
jgi:hypothetical protein